MTYDEIAAALDIPSGTVKTRMRMALENLRTILAPTKADATQP
ncbi:MAG: RNA polymerase sigma factor [Blastopirellula sp. JB062]